MEPFLINHYGKEIYFATAMGSLFQFNDNCYLDFFKDFMERNDITEIFITIETSCRFLNNILNQQININYWTEKTMRAVLLNNSDEVHGQATLFGKQQCFAKQLIKHQVMELEKISLFSSLRQQSLLTFSGLIVSRPDRYINEIKINTN